MTDTKYGRIGVHQRPTCATPHSVVRSKKPLLAMMTTETISIEIPEQTVQGPYAIRSNVPDLTIERVIIGEQLVIDEPGMEASLLGGVILDGPMLPPGHHVIIHLANNTCASMEPTVVFYAHTTRQRHALGEPTGGREVVDDFIAGEPLRDESPDSPRSRAFRELAAKNAGLSLTGFRPERLRIPSDIAFDTPEPGPIFPSRTVTSVAPTPVELRNEYHVVAQRSDGSTVDPSVPSCSSIEHQGGFVPCSKCGRADQIGPPTRREYLRRTLEQEARDKGQLVPAAAVGFIADAMATALGRDGSRSRPEDDDPDAAWESPHDEWP